MILLLLACPTTDTSSPAPTGTDHHTGTTTPPTTPDAAVTAVSATQDGAEVVFTFTTAAPVTRNAGAVLTFATGAAFAVTVPISAGSGTAAVEIPDPCDLLGTTTTVAVRVDDATFDVEVTIDGVVSSSLLEVSATSGVGALCGGAMPQLEAESGIYLLRADAVFLTADQGYSGILFQQHVGLWLHGRYDVIWHGIPELMVWWEREP